MEYKKKCNSCGKELPEDSLFCQYCGSKDILSVETQSNNRNFKRCIDCGKELPLDSDFCQYCGSNNIVLVTDLDINKTDNHTSYDESKKYKKRFTVVLIIAVCLLCGLLYFVSMYNEVNLENESLTNKLSSQEIDLKTAKSTANTNRIKANNFDIIKNLAGNSSNSNFFATQTVLKNPNKTRVVFYIPYSGSYSIEWSYSSGITITTGNTNSGLVYIDVTYSGSDVGTIKCTNSVNNSKIVIYCIGS